MMDSCLKATLNQTVYVASQTGNDSFGDSTFGTAEKRKARVEPDNRRIINPFTGKEEITSHRIVLENSMGLHDRIWLPGILPTNTTDARVPKAVRLAPNEDGSTHHYEILV